MEYQVAAQRFEAAIDLDPMNTPARLNLGDVHFYLGETAAAVEAWERLIERSPDRAYLASRASRGHIQNATARAIPGAMPAPDCTESTGLAGAAGARRHMAAQGNPREALDVLFEALEQNPHALALHQTIWQMLSRLQLPPALVHRYIEITRDAIFYVDPHICVRCRYRSTELLWQCPHCHEWNTFVEERIAPAKDSEATLTS